MLSITLAKPFNRVITVLTIISLTACATIPEYEPIVDTSDVDDMEQYALDMEECQSFADSVDYSDEKTISALKGAGVGVGAVGAGVAVTLATGGIVLLPVVAPIYLAGAWIGGESNRGATSRREQAMKATVWNSCLSERGYKVFSDSRS